MVERPGPVQEQLGLSRGKADNRTMGNAETGMGIREEVNRGHNAAQVRQG